MKLFYKVILRFVLVAALSSFSCIILRGILERIMLLPCLLQKVYEAQAPKYDIVQSALKKKTK
jgi:hypothetical protein